jgi:NAD(P)-dependent dehydrogenase (short-subunit alcohol dehydrogenase family)
LGNAISRLFARAGARIVLTSRSEGELASMIEDLNRHGLDAHYFVKDLTQEGAARELVDFTAQRMGKIDILVNNAGINKPQKAEDVSLANWDAVMEINLRSVFLLSQAAGRHMIPQGSGKIINISSDAGLVALPLRSAYCSSKAGLNGLTRSLALEWAPHGISVNAIAPTFVETPFVEKMFQDPHFKQYVLDNIPFGRMATTKEVAYAALYLASDFADIVTGHVLVVDGGWTVK